LRAVFIFAGVALINQFHWIIYVFGAFLVFTGIKMLFHNDDKVKPDRGFSAVNPASLDDVLFCFGVR
jgi:predicted tellurium resistance membrane protein TerC